MNKLVCDICGKGRHDPSCPYYASRKRHPICSCCGGEICDGEEYVVNQDGEFRHSDCFYTLKEAVKWLGFEVKVMEDDDEWTELLGL